MTPRAADTFPCPVCHKNRERYGARIMFVELLKLRTWVCGTCKKKATK